MLNDFKLHICGWFGIRIENIQSDPPKDDGEPDACQKLESEKRPKIG